MSMSGRRIAARVSVAALTISCGHATGVVEPTTPLAREAIHFDQLLGSACSNNSQHARCAFLANFALPPAFGAAPSPLQIDDGAKTSTVQGFILENDYLDAQGNDSARSFTLMTYGDSNVTSGILVSPGLRERLYDTTTTELAIDSADDFEVNSVPGPCTKPPALRYTTVPALIGGTCETRTFMVVTGITFPGQNIGIYAQAANGIILRYKKNP